VTGDFGVGGFHYAPVVDEAGGGPAEAAQLLEEPAKQRAFRGDVWAQGVKKRSQRRVRWQGAEKGKAATDKMLKPP
jgi:hypothetical protein